MIRIYYSITFSNPDGSNPINTYDDWRIVPESRPLVNPPEVRTEFVDIPGADGSLDYTEALAGIKFKNREGSWTFYVLNELFDRSRSYLPWNELYTLIMRKLHGRRKMIRLESDPGFYYMGRLFVDSWSSDKDYSKITIRYNIDPYKQPDKTTKEYDWQWSELFNNVIYYGTFDVDGKKDRNFFNYQEHPIVPKYHFDAPMNVFDERSGQTRSYQSGTHDGWELLEGDNFYVFYGTGRVVVDYSPGRRL